jgi:hypothetical protein
MAREGYPKTRPAVLGSAYAVLAALVAGIASVAVQGGTIAGYVLFVVLLAAAIGLGVLAYNASSRARTVDSPES